MTQVLGTVNKDPRTMFILWENTQKLSCDIVLTTEQALN